MTSTTATAMRSQKSLTNAFYRKTPRFCLYRIALNRSNAAANTSTGMIGDRKIGEQSPPASQASTTMVMKSERQKAVGNPITTIECCLHLVSISHRGQSSVTIAVEVPAPSFRPAIATTTNRCRVRASRTRIPARRPFDIRVCCRPLPSRSGGPDLQSLPG